jgi:hypothetical protein
MKIKRKAVVPKLLKPQGSVADRLGPQHSQESVGRRSLPKPVGLDGQIGSDEPVVCVMRITI